MDARGWQYSGDGNVGDHPRLFSTANSRNPNHDEKMTALHITFNTNQFLYAGALADQQIRDAADHVQRVMSQWARWVHAVEPEFVDPGQVQWRASLEGDMQQGQRLHCHAIIKIPHRTTIALTPTLRNLNRYARRDGSPLCYVHATLLYTDKHIEDYVDKDTGRYKGRCPGEGEDVDVYNVERYVVQQHPPIPVVFPADDSVVFAGGGDIADAGEEAGEYEGGVLAVETPAAKRRRERMEARVARREYRAEQQRRVDRRRAIDAQRENAARAAQGDAPRVVTRAAAGRQGTRANFAERAGLLRHSLSRAVVDDLARNVGDVRTGTVLLQDGALLPPGVPVPLGGVVRVIWRRGEGGAPPVPSYMRYTIPRAAAPGAGGIPGLGGELGMVPLPAVFPGVPLVPARRGRRGGPK